MRRPRQTSPCGKPTLWSARSAAWSRSLETRSAPCAKHPSPRRAWNLRHRRSRGPACAAFVDPQRRATKRSVVFAGLSSKRNARMGSRPSRLPGTATTRGTTCRRRMPMARPRRRRHRYRLRAGKATHPRGRSLCRRLPWTRRISFQACVKSWRKRARVWDCHVASSFPAASPRSPAIASPYRGRPCWLLPTFLAAKRAPGTLLLLEARNPSRPCGRRRVFRPMVCVWSANHPSHLSNLRQQP